MPATNLNVRVGGCAVRGFVQGSKGQEGELFGIQNLLKFSDDSLLKALRTKHEAALAAAGAGGVGAAAAAAAGAGVGGAGGNKGGGSGNSLGVVGVDTADEAELMLAMKVALDRAKEEGAEGEAPRRQAAGVFAVLLFLSIVFTFCFLIVFSAFASALLLCFPPATISFRNLYGTLRYAVYVLCSSFLFVLVASTVLKAKAAPAAAIIFFYRECPPVLCCTLLRS